MNHDDDDDEDDEVDEDDKDDEDDGEGDDGDDDGDVAKTLWWEGGNNLNNVALRTFYLIALSFSCICQC